MQRTHEGAGRLSSRDGLARLLMNRGSSWRLSILAGRCDCWARRSPCSAARARRAHPRPSATRRRPATTAAPARNRAATSGGVIEPGDSGVVTGSDAGRVTASDDSGASAGTTDSGAITGPPATGAGGAACPSLTGPADRSYPRWAVSNPASTHLPNPSSYADNGDGTVTDHVTGLVWQKVVSGSDTFAGAPAYCAGLTLPAPAGFTWQVPTRVQLLSILDPTTGAGVDAPFLASGQPPGGKYTWTSTPWVVSQIATKPQDAWMVNYGGGGGLTSNAAAQSAVEWIRCVAAPAVTPLPYPHYVQVGAGEVQDVETGLVWAQASHNAW